MVRSILERLTFCAASRIFLVNLKGPSQSPSGLLKNLTDLGPCLYSQRVYLVAYSSQCYKSNFARLHPGVSLTVFVFPAGAHGNSYRLVKTCYFECQSEACFQF